MQVPIASIPVVVLQPGHSAGKAFLIAAPGDEIEVVVGAVQHVEAAA